ncbi:histidine triad nucleotide-binding protein [Haloferula sp. A504]|uniref:histidine triad nucleotide-binding protein n=1 Tax=Haloferula sp. A504 TaxID=3373601 RepID=UPI0031C4EA18|nr:histidine triad nucleotide-binding protein [Verrucomicrobiaceae bacterium E54]
MADDKTIFEKIRDGEIPAEIVHEDEHCLCFRDISPQAPTHLLLVPKRRVARLTAAGQADGELLGHLMLASATVAREQGFAESGYRVVINNGPDGGEEVPHLHLHLLAGRRLEWPPG